ncbi:MAG: M23 family metallopeptidase [Clostridia bacterium]|nr:M23 family metallopeptidase [Clostridia bacterium]
MKNQETKKSKKKVLLYYLILAACLLVIAAVTVTVIFTVRGSDGNLSIDSGTEKPDDGNKDPDEGNKDPDDPASVDTSYLAPVKAVALANEFDLIHNETLDWYYRHEGFDFAGNTGDEVVAMQDGTVKSVVYETDPSAVITGGYLEIDHGNGIVATYQFIDVAAGIGRGSVIKRGQILGKMSEELGTEKYVGAHLHLEIRENCELVDPQTFLEIIGK